MPHEIQKAIHATWLLTPREDLHGACPREVALEQRDHLSWDLEDQCQRWSRLGKCRPGLPPSSFAYRHGGFGTHELVQYYGLVRALLSSCWQQLVQLGARPGVSGPESLTVGDFLTMEVPRLERIRDEWLDKPDPEFHGRTPRAIIDRGRARLPEVVSADEAMIDDDCPCCQMLADLPGPTFWHLDGCNMDVDFAFDIYHRTREEWDAEQREWDEHSKRFNAEWAERERLGITGHGSDQPGEGSVWSSSFAAADGPGTPPSIRLFGIGSHLAELIVDLRGKAGDPSAGKSGQRFIDQLNRDFGNLREVLQACDPSAAEALVVPVIDHFADSLAAVASACPDPAAKCETLTSNIMRLLDPPPSESPEESEDSDLPF